MDLKNWGIRVNYCWNCEPSKLLLYFIEYYLDQLNNNHTKVAVNSTIQNTISWKPLSKELPRKSLKIFDLPTTKWQLCKVFDKLNEKNFLLANNFQLHKYQTLGLMKMHNMSKTWFANYKFSLWKSLVYD